MRYRAKTKEEMQVRIDILESMGLEIGHEDSRVYAQGSRHMGYTIDFSAVGALTTHVVLTKIIDKVYEEGMERGRDEIRHEIRDTLGLDQSSLQEEFDDTAHARKGEWS